ncbi:hypothetical protein CY0110_18732 [Crocosphaera chwakensis CCY0110]|uniref:Uncharacterized protein n=1 Tax=Crocosphaera chwakensis CCY0110 TaxID=391612 RepID=A3IJ78_9CHRO|nr:hypothetical protein CY0110_18732 [Crocosphaera chwakensis CCY0110]
MEIFFPFSLGNIIMTLQISQIIA